MSFWVWVYGVLGSGFKVFRFRVCGAAGLGFKVQSMAGKKITAKLHGQLRGC